MRSTSATKVRERTFVRDSETNGVYATRVVGKRGGSDKRGRQRYTTDGQRGRDRKRGRMNEKRKSKGTLSLVASFSDFLITVFWAKAARVVRSRRDLRNRMMHNGGLAMLHRSTRIVDVNSLSPSREKSACARTERQGELQRVAPAIDDNNP